MVHKGHKEHKELKERKGLQQGLKVI